MRGHGIVRCDASQCAHDRHTYEQAILQSYRPRLLYHTALGAVQSNPIGLLCRGAFSVLAWHDGPELKNIHLLTNFAFFYWLRTRQVAQ